MFSAALKSGAAAAPPDAQFNYVTMLLHGDGTNGAQNNTFLDSSTNNFSITRNGNTTQGSFSPYGSNWSNFFPSSSYLEIANNTALQMSTGDFTIEFWLNFSSLSNYQTIFTKGYTAAGGLLVQTNTGTGTLLIYAAGSVVITASSASTLGTWNHYALVRNSGTLTLYLNGTSVGSVSNSTNFNNTESFNVGGSVSGYYTNGYISNFRVVKGTAVYTGSFTPSTTPLTAITNTQLLTCQSNRFVDNSANAFSSTITGAPSVQRFNPFGTSTAYSTSVIGGSGYFDGSGDYLTASATNIANFGTGDFIVSAWFNSTTTTGNQKIFDNYNGNNNPNPSLILNLGGAGTANWYAGQTAVITSSSTYIPNTWNYVVVSRVSSTTKMFLNGTQVGSVSDTRTYAAGYTTVGIGGEPYSSGGAPFPGYITDLQVVKGSGVTSSTVPTAPVSASGSTLHLGMTNGAIFDNAMMNDLETVGNAQISTSVKKFGTGSLAFDGTGDWLTSLDNPSHEFGSGNFTLECWINTTVSNSGYVSAVAKWSSSNQSWMIRAASTDIGSGWSFFYSTDGSNYYTVFGASINDGNWHHLAVTRSGNVFRTFTDGTLNNSTTDAVTLFDGTASLFVGAQGGGSNPFTGYIDDLRITKGYARYTASFTAPTAAFPNTGPY